ncbi:MAG TPA: AI-2E family transporter [Gemmatimonadaceae bacterium]|jgi:predicted PurR-regulated permease PerM|nr:AI-2E family transporter [Gemmatimonadaceae bacterium]
MPTRETFRIPTRDVVRILSLIFGFYVAVRLLWIAHPVIFLFFLGVLFALPISQAADWLQKRRIPRGLGVAIILTVFLGLLIGGGIGMAPILRSQSKELQDRLPEALDKIDAWLGHRANGVLGILFNQESSSDDTTTVSEPAKTDSSATDTAAVPPTDSATKRTTTRSNEVVVGGNLRREITRQVSGAQHSFLRMLTSTFAVTGAFLLVLFIAAYIGLDPHLYHGGVLALVPSRERDRAALALARLATVLRRWLVTQLIAMVVIGAVTTLFLLSIHVKAALPLGILAGVSKFIPIVGSIFAAIPSIAMAFIDSPHKALVVGIGYILIQFVENHVLVPVLMKRGVNLPPAMTLGIQALMALLFGFLGLLVAVPLLAAILTIVRTMNEKELREISEETTSRLPAGDEAIERAFDHRTGDYQ